MANNTSVGRWKSVALPTEHGGWGFLIEPMLLGMLVAPSWAGLCICLSALGIFLIHQPLRIATKDRLRGRHFTRTAYAERFAAAYGAIALGGFGLAVLTAQTPFWIPLLLAVPMAGVQLLYETRNRGRELLPEIFGAVALGATAPAIVLAAGCSSQLALLVWLLVILRIVPSIVYVRVRLSALHGHPLPQQAALIPHLIAVIVVGIAWVNGLVMWSTSLAISILLLRAILGVRRSDEPARKIGFQELGYGIVYVILGAVGVPPVIC